MEDDAQREAAAMQLLEDLRKLNDYQDIASVGLLGRVTYLGEYTPQASQVVKGTPVICRVFAFADNEISRNALTLAYKTLASSLEGSFGMTLQTPTIIFDPDRQQLYAISTAVKSSVAQTVNVEGGSGGISEGQMSTLADKLNQSLTNVLASTNNLALATARSVEEAAQKSEQGLSRLEQTTARRLGEVKTAQDKVVDAVKDLTDETKKANEADQKAREEEQKRRDDERRLQQAEEDRLKQIRDAEYARRTYLNGKSKGIEVRLIDATKQQDFTEILHELEQILYDQAAIIDRLDQTDLPHLQELFIEVFRYVTPILNFLTDRRIILVNPDQLIANPIRDLVRSNYRPGQELELLETLREFEIAWHNAHLDYIFIPIINSNQYSVALRRLALYLNIRSNSLKLKNDGK